MKYLGTKAFALTMCGLLCATGQAATNEGIPKGEIRILAKSCSRTGGRFRARSAMRWI